ncbi:hypothetical protein GQ44DRAFT_700863 [Phaeosphaeriaceae sp. PMI808]|nr:hypothetical protein GQ44DRAFT_700863 [Phaeosphaeriaceae sp. PMI808]
MFSLQPQHQPSTAHQAIPLQSLRATSPDCLTSIACNHLYPLARPTRRRNWVVVLCVGSSYMRLSAMSKSSMRCD